MIHELVHGYVLYAGSMDQNFVNNLKEFAIENVNTFTHDNNFHHEVMRQYVTGMANALYFWDKEFGSGGNLGSQYYMDMAYSGLFTIDANGNFLTMTDAFKTLVPEGERNRVKNVIIAEMRGINSKGTKCK